MGNRVLMVVLLCTLAYTDVIEGMNCLRWPIVPPQLGSVELLQADTNPAVV